MREEKSNVFGNSTDQQIWSDCTVCVYFWIFICLKEEREGFHGSIGLR